MRKPGAMACQLHIFWNRPFARKLILWGALALLARLPAFADQSVTLTWNPSPNANVVGYNIYYGGASRTYTNSVTVGNVTNVTIPGFSEGMTYYFAATTLDSTGDESDFSNEASYVIPLSVTNPLPWLGNQAAPSFAALTNLTIYQNAGTQTVLLTNINSGLLDGNVNVSFSADSSDHTIVPAATVNYTNGNNFGSLTFAPVAGALGTATVTVTVNNGSASNNITTQTFAVTVVPVPVVYLPPTLNALTNLTIYQNAGPQTVLLTNINSGLLDGNANVSISADSSDHSIVPVPVVNYTNGNNFGSLTFAPVAGALGTATATVTVNNGSASNNITTQTFAITVVPVPVVYLPPTLNALTNLTIYQNAGSRTVALSGISSGSSNQNQTVTVLAVSSNPALIPTPAVNYASPSNAGSLTFAPATNALGTATLTVTVNNGDPSNNIITQVFTVTVVPAPVASQLPTLDPIANVTVAQGAAAQIITLTGISSGLPAKNPLLKISAVSSNPRLVPTPRISYTSPASTAALTIQPPPNNTGSALITVTVNNGARSNNIIRRTFTVTVPTNHPPTLDPIANVSLAENAAAQTITLTGITSGSPTENQTLRVSAVSSNPRLVPALLVQYVSPSNSAVLTFKPFTNRSGAATITVTVNDGGRNNNTIRKSFTVTVAAPAANPSGSVGQVVGNTAAILTTMANDHGRFSFKVTGVSSGKYVVQATSDLVHWTSVQTNTAPFNFQDNSANPYSQRFYRAIHLP
jgi:hypothetical protein